MRNRPRQGFKTLRNSIHLPKQLAGVVHIRNDPFTNPLTREDAIMAGLIPTSH